MEIRSSLGAQTAEFKPVRRTPSNATFATMSSAPPAFHTTRTPSLPLEITRGSKEAKPDNPVEGPRCVTRESQLLMPTHEQLLREFQGFARTATNADVLMRLLPSGSTKPCPDTTAWVSTLPTPAQVARMVVFQLRLADIQAITRGGYRAQLKAALSFVPSLSELLAYHS